MSTALLQSAVLYRSVAAYKGVSTLLEWQKFKRKTSKWASGCIPPSSCLKCSETWGADNGHFAFSAAGSAQLEFSSPGVPKSTLGPTSLPSVSTEKAACSGYRGCQNKTTAWVAAKKTCTSWHFSLGLVIRPPPKHGFSSLIVSMINASQEMYAESQHSKIC